MPTTTRRRSRTGGSFPRSTEARVAAILRGVPRTPGAPAVAALAIALSLPAALAEAQTPSPAPAAQPSSAPDALTRNSEPANEQVTLSYFNRYIVTLRAKVIGRSPDQRAKNVVRALDELVEARTISPVTARHFEGGALILVGTRTVLAMTTNDVEELSGENVDRVAADAASRLAVALAEADEARLPGMLLRESGIAAAGLAVGLLTLFGLLLTERAIVRKVNAIAERTLTEAGISDAEG